MPSIVRLRKRLPLVASILLVLLCLLAIGAVCACATSNHPAQAIEHAVGSIQSAVSVPVMQVWAMLALVLLMPTAVVRRGRHGFGRASPAELQRFLF